MKKNKLINLIKLKHKLYKKGFIKISKFIDLLFRVFFSMDFPSSVICGDGLILPHLGLGVVIHPRAIIGNNCKIYQNVTIGCRNNQGPPKIGDNCLIGAGACILGNVVVGNGCSIGSNAVVLCDVPDNSVVVGIPGKIIKRNEFMKGDI